MKGQLESLSLMSNAKQGSILHEPIIHLASKVSPRLCSLPHLLTMPHCDGGCPSFISACAPAHIQLSAWEPSLAAADQSALKHRRLIVKELNASLEHLPTEDWWQLVSKYSSCLSFWWNNCKACILHWFAEFSRGIKLQLWTMMNLLDYACFYWLPSFPSLVLILLLVFPGVSSQINCLFSYYCFRVYFWRNSN